MTDLEIDFLVKDDRWNMAGFDLEKRTHQAAAHIITSGSLSCVLADDAFVRDLNKTHRGKDKPTNILSFPMEDEDMLGDLVLAYDTIKAEAIADQKTLENHYLHLIVHGILHLLGYDHINDIDAEEMEKKEIEILKQLKITNPYE